MKLSISNIAWDATNDDYVYGLMKKYGFAGLEIAPTKILAESPYSRIEEAKEWKKYIEETYGFNVSSMQSIWYGRNEKIFRNEEEREVLFEYTKSAIDFASAIGCKNLVFGCPRNRNIDDDMIFDKDIIIKFFKELGDYAVEKNTVIGMEANPTIYNTNYINSTDKALELINDVDSKGFKLNLDIGTIIQNNEAVDCLRGNVSKINHVHISEPNLKPIEKRIVHSEIYKILSQENYSGYISIEMGKMEEVSTIEHIMEYVRDLLK